jgi:hypothetical protein
MDSDSVGVQFRFRAKGSATLIQRHIKSARNVGIHATSMVLSFRHMWLCQRFLSVSSHRDMTPQGSTSSFSGRFNLGYPIYVDPRAVLHLVSKRKIPAPGNLRPTVLCSHSLCARMPAVCTLHPS